jgi:hypothetical protein
MKKLIVLSLLLSGCKEVKLVGDYFAKIYPKDGYADVVQVEQEEPIKVGEAVETKIEDLSGWICVPEKQFAKYRRAYDLSKQKNTVLKDVELKLKQREELK